MSPENDLFSLLCLSNVTLSGKPHCKRNEVSHILTKYLQYVEKKKNHEQHYLWYSKLCYNMLFASSHLISFYTVKKVTPPMYDNCCRLYHYSSLDDLWCPWLSFKGPCDCGLPNPAAHQQEGFQEWQDEFLYFTSNYGKQQKSSMWHKQIKL